MTKQSFSGYVLRLWTETEIDGWQSDFERYETRAAAERAGENFIRNIKSDELNREYEIFEKFIFI